MKTIVAVILVVFCVSSWAGGTVRKRDGSLKTKIVSVNTMVLAQTNA